MANESSSIVPFYKFEKWLRETFPRDVIDPTYKTLSEPAFQYKLRDLKNPLEVQAIKEKYFGAKPAKFGGLKFGKTKEDEEVFYQHPYFHQKLKAIHPEGDIYTTQRLTKHSAERAVIDRVGLFKGVFEKVKPYNFIKAKIHNEHLNKDTHFFMHEFLGYIPLERQREVQPEFEPTDKALFGGMLVEVQLHKDYGNTVIHIHHMDGPLKYLNYLNRQEFNTFVTGNNNRYALYVDTLATDRKVAQEMLDDQTQVAILNLFDELVNYPDDTKKYMPTIEIRGDKLYIYANGVLLRTANTSNNYSDPNMLQLYNRYSILANFIANITL